MHPIIWSSGPITLFGQIVGPLRFYSYGFCLALAFAVSITLFARDAAKRLAPRLALEGPLVFQKIFDLATWVIVLSLVGARLFYILENHTEFTGQWLDAFKIWQGGLVYYGGLFGAVLAGFLWIRREKWPFAYFFDLVAPYILLGQAFGRVGCFLNGCCYGNVDYQHGLIFPGAPDNLPHLPTQLWELYGDLALFFILLYARKWTIKFPWMGIALYGFCYGILRYVIEFWRRDWDKKYLVFFNSASQAVSGILIALSLAVILWSLIRHKHQENNKNKI